MARKFNIYDEKNLKNGLNQRHHQLTLDMKIKVGKKSALFIEKLIIITFIIVICVAVLEIGLRSIGRQPTNTTMGIAEQWGSCFRLKENIEKTINWPAFSFTIYTNEFGFRDKEIGKRDIDKNPYYVFLGASEVFANGVNFEDSFVGIFAEHALKKGVNVLNLAVGGHRFPDQDSLFKEFLSNAPKKPSICFNCVNELHIPKFDKKQENLIVKNGHVFEKHSWKSAYIRLLLGDHSAAYVFLRNNIRKLQEQYLNFRPSGNMPEFFQIYSKKNRMSNPDTIKQFENYLQGFEKYCYDSNITPIFVYLPITDSFDLNDLLKQHNENPEDYDPSYYSRLMEDYCQKYNSNLINLRPVLEKHHNDGKDLRFKLDPHFNMFSNRVIGEYLIQAIFQTQETSLAN